MEPKRLLACYKGPPLIRILNQENSVHASTHIYLRSI
jgi:hypothetical protein